ncbi:MAG: homocysteine S-methyltransferase family protein [Ilumatobacteraceae bacterium]
MRRAFVDLVRERVPVLGDCATGTRLHLQSPLPTDDQLGLVPLVDDDLGATAIRAVGMGYAAMAAEFGLPIVIDAVTWWARSDRLARHGITGDAAKALLRRCVEVVLPVRDHFDDVYVSAALGPSTDGYRPGDVDVDDAIDYHGWHVEQLAATDADVLVAGTFSTANDLVAIAHVLAATDRPYVLGPIVDSTGCMPDGTPLHELIDSIESSVSRLPSHWALYCTHPDIARAAMEVVGTADAHAHRRVRQLKGNGTAASSEERDHADHVLCDEPEPWALAAMQLHDEHGFNIIGGCCGTDDRHLLSLAIRLSPIRAT